MKHPSPGACAAETPALKAGSWGAETPSQQAQSSAGPPGKAPPPPARHTPRRHPHPPLAAVGACAGSVPGANAAAAPELRARRWRRCGCGRSGCRSWRWCGAAGGWGWRASPPRLRQHRRKVRRGGEPRGSAQPFLSLPPRGGARPWVRAVGPFPRCFSPEGRPRPRAGLREGRAEAPARPEACRRRAAARERLPERWRSAGLCLGPGRSPEEGGQPPAGQDRLRPGGGLAHSFRPKEGATAVGLVPPGGLRGRGVIGNSAARRQHSPGFSLPRRVMRNVAWKEKLTEMLLLSCLLCWSSLSRSCFWKAVGEARPQIWLPLTGVTRKVLIGLVCIKLGYLKWTLTCVFRVQFEVFHFFYGRVYT